ncbi:MAG: hypothetical protein EXS46_02265 [Candidatus Taylorbacteria bacterium]|nr:hypothetical protein [Candidatus Taylorbacteria bacterium]
MKTESFSKIEVLPFFVLKACELPSTRDGSDITTRAYLGPTGTELVNEYLSKGWEILHFSSHVDDSKNATVHAVVVGKPRMKR